MTKAFLTVIAATLCTVVPARAQVTPPTPPPTPPSQDTTRGIPTRDSSFVRDSLLRVDSLRTAMQRDSIPDSFPQLAMESQPSFGSGTWSWDLNGLAREGPITLGDLLRRIPGMTALRAGGYSQPEMVTSYGLTRGRVQVEVDGYVLDPLTSSLYDLAGIELINLVGVRVERRLDMIRIKLVTAQPTNPRPYTRLEVATGQPDINVFRAIFMVPSVIVGPLALAIDRVGSDGIGRAEPASALGGWAKWTWTGKTRGLQFEYRRHNLKREGTSPWPTNRTRQDIVLRARQQLMTGLTAELFGGRSTVRDVSDSLSNATSDDSVPALERGVWQGGARAGFTRGPVFASATLRMRDAKALPKQELEVSAGFETNMLQVGGDFAQQSWKSGAAASTYNVRAAAGPVAGFGAFVELASGDRGAPIYGDSSGITTREDHELTKRNAVRAGATMRRFGIEGGGALLRVTSEATAPFGLPFDSAFRTSLVDPATGFEAWGRIGLFKNRFFVDGSYTYYTKSPGWTYLPTRSWRVAGEAHLTPLASGNLEILARVESVFRGQMLAYGDPDVPADSVNLQFEVLDQNHVLNGYLQIRIIDVRAFIQWEDMLGKGRLDIPARVIPGPRMYYGVKWELFN